MMKTSDPSHEGSFFQPLSFGGTLHRMMTVYRRGFQTFHLIMLLIGGSFCIFWGLMLFLLPFLFGVDPYVADPYYRDENAIAFFALFIVQSCAASLFGCVGHGAIIRATADIYLQAPTATARSYVAVGFRFFCSNMLAGILIFLGVCFGLLLFIFPGVYVGVAWLLAHNAIVLEGLGGMGGLKRSFGLVRGSWCYVFGVKLVLMIPFAILNKLWIDHVAPFIFTLAGFMVAAIPSLLIAPFLSILVTVIYLNLRIQKEGLDAQALAGNLGLDNPNFYPGKVTADPAAVVGIPDFA